MPPAAPAETRFPTPFWLLLVGVPAVFFGLMLALDNRPLAADRWVVDQAEGVSSEALRPPGSGADWHRVPLDAAYSDVGSTYHRTATWWRVGLPDAVRGARTRWMLVIPSPALASYELWIDGRYVDARGDAEGLQILRTPTWFTVVNGETTAPEHAHLRIVRGMATVYVPRMLVGPKSELESATRFLDTVYRQLPQAFLAMMTLLAAIMGSVHLLRRGNDPVFGWYALMLAIWALHLSHAVNENPPFGDAMFWIVASHWTMGWFVIVATLFIHRLLRLVHPRVERVLVGWGAACSLVFLVAWIFNVSSNGFRSYIWDPSILLMGGYMVVLLVGAVRREKTADSMGLLILAVFLLLVGLRDFAHTHPSLSVPGNFLYLRFAAGLALLAFSVLLIRRFVNALDTAESLNENLEHKVEEKTRELTLQHARTRQLEREHVLNDERRRLLGEMHDGLGGHIVHALAAAERDASLQPMVGPLKLALEDLRLIIDSLDPDDGSFDAVFAALRLRCARTAESLDMGFTWRIDPVFAELDLNPHEVLTLARIAQEAVTNVIKHAGASQLSVTGSVDDDGVARFTVVDDGCGLTDSNGGGRGMTNMQGRARELDAELQIADAAPGTRVRLSFRRERRSVASEFDLA